MMKGEKAVACCDASEVHVYKMAGYMYRGRELQYLKSKLKGTVKSALQRNSALKNCVAGSGRSRTGPVYPEKEYLEKKISRKEEES